MIADSLQILFITHYSEMYGANKSLCQLMLELKQTYNIKPTVLLRSKGSICGFLEANNIKYYVSHYYWWVYEGDGLKNKFHNYLKQLRNIKRVNRIFYKIKDEKIDLIYSNSFVVNVGGILSKKLKCKQIWHLRETLQAYNFKLSLGVKLSKRILNRENCQYIAISDFVVKAYKYLVPMEKITRVYNGIKIQNGILTSNKIADSINICVIGVLSEQKNQLDALKAFKILKEQKMLNKIKLHLVGSNITNYLNLLKEYVIQHELDNSIIIHGHINNVSEFLKSMHLGLTCSRDEAFGRVTIEYMLNRLPVIVSNSGANPELVQNEKNGFIYQIYNEGDLADKILRFVGNPGLLDELGAFAQKYAIENFSSAKNTSQIYQLISKVIHN